MGSSGSNADHGIQHVGIERAHDAGDLHWIVDWVAPDIPVGPSGRPADGPLSGYQGGLSGRLAEPEGPQEALTASSFIRSFPRPSAERRVPPSLGSSSVPPLGLRSAPNRPAPARLLPLPRRWAAGLAHGPCGPHAALLPASFRSASFSRP